MLAYEADYRFHCLQLTHTRNALLSDTCLLICFTSSLSLYPKLQTDYVYFLSTSLHALFSIIRHTIHVIYPVIILSPESKVHENRNLELEFKTNA